MSDVIDRDGFRANVGIVLMSHENKVFLGRRAGGRGWQFPQGGMRRGESIEESLFRELQEEIGLTRGDVTVVGGTRRWLRYRLPERYVRRERVPLCLGQKQRWFLLRLTRDATEFRFDHTDEPEFESWRWADYWDPVREVIYFKRSVYLSALHELAALVAADATPPPYPQGWPVAWKRGRRAVAATT